MQQTDARANHAVRAAALVLAVICVVALLDSPTADTLYSARPSPFPLSELLVLLAGLGIGCYGTLVGIGGGPLIVPALVFFYGWPAKDVVATALLVVMLNALSGTTGYAYQRRVDYQGGLKFAIAALPGSILSGLVHRYYNLRSFDTIFGLFLVGLAIFCALGARHVDDSQRVTSAAIDPSHRLVVFRDRFGTKYRFGVNDGLGASLNFVLGFLVGFLGIGGGVLQVPILVFALRYPVHVATATSHFITMLTCLYALAPNLAFGNVHFGQAFWMGLGVLVGAQAGAWLSPSVRSTRIMYLFIGVILIFGVSLLST